MTEIKGVVLLMNHPVFEVRSRTDAKKTFLVYKKVRHIPGLVTPDAPEPWAYLGHVLTDADVLKEAEDGQLVPMTVEEKIRCAVRRALEDCCIELAGEFPLRDIDTVLE
jgi:hypothetical protein